MWQRGCFPAHVRKIVYMLPVAFRGSSASSGQSQQTVPFVFLADWQGVRWVLFIHVPFEARGLGKHLLAAGARVEHLAVAGNMTLEVLHECLLALKRELAQRTAHGQVPLGHAGLGDGGRDAVAAAQVCCQVLALGKGLGTVRALVPGLVAVGAHVAVEAALVGEAAGAAPARVWLLAGVSAPVHSQVAAEHGGVRAEVTVEAPCPARHRCPPGHCNSWACK
uniref:Uncharacterized protein n=1 Tax=Rhipicephalus pulchellus TaxID=72859 RepID=L7LXN5_RHIPC